MTGWGALALAVVLLAANAFFVGAEFAVISARRSSIEPLAEAGSRGARTVLWAMENVSTMLACSQLGITVASTSLGVVAEPALAEVIEPLLRPLGLGGATHPLALVLALLLVVYLHVVLGEMVPKNLAVAGPQRAVLMFGPPLVWIARSLAPVIRLLNAVANLILRVFGFEPKEEVTSAFTAAEVQAIVERSRAEGLLDDSQGLLSGAIEFSDRTAADVMLRVRSLETLPLGCTAADVEHAVARTGFSRIVITDADGGVIGYLHIKDVLHAGPGEREEPVPDWRVRALVPVSPGDEIEDALAAMQRSGSHLAQVRDGSGALQGVVFLEDVVELLVGEVRDAMQRRSAGRTNRLEDGAGG